jgi:uncharacterized protein (TIGR03086 family)
LWVRDLVAVLAEPNRRRLLELLAQGEQNVGALAVHFGVTRPAISQHLGVLAGAGLVQSRRAGRFRYYRLHPEGMAALRASLEVFWAAELEDLAAQRPRRKGVPQLALEKSITVPLGPQETFALLTEPARLRRWQAITARIELRAGGEYRWTIVPGHTAAGTVAEIDKGRRLVLTWGWEDSADLPPGASTLTITFEPAGEGTRVHLVHDGLTDEQAASHEQGWRHYFERLRRAATTGDAGADEWVTGARTEDRLTAAEASLASCQLVLRTLTESSGTASTPCATFTVDQLIDHLLQSIVGLGAMAGASIATPSDPDPEVRVAEPSQQCLEAWRRRGTEGTVPFGGGTLPASSAAGILSIEFLVHGWDLAKATTTPLIAGDELSEYVLELAREVIRPEMRDGDRFAPEVPVGAGAEAVERLVAFTGREP